MLLSSHDAVAAVPNIFYLAAGVGLVAWDEATPSAGKLLTYVDGVPASRPHASVTVPTTSGGRRTLLALKLPSPRAGSAALTVRDVSGGTVLETIVPADPALLRDEPSSLTEGLEPLGQVRVARFLLNVCRPAFALGRQPRFASFCRALVLGVAPQPVPLRCRALLTSKLALHSGALPAAFGAVQSVTLIGRASVDRNRFLPNLQPAAARRSADAPFELVLEQRERAAAPLLLVMIGTGGLACRMVERPSVQEPNFLALLEGKNGLADWSRDYVMTCLAAFGPADRQASALLRDVQVLMPRPARQLGNPEQPLGAALDLAMGQGTGGLFLAGWLRDPCGLVESISAVSPFGSMPVPDHAMHRVRCRPVEKRYKGAKYPSTDRKLGFVAYLPESGDPGVVQQYRLRLLLRSGGSTELVAPPAPQDPAAARNAVLGCVPPEDLTEEVLTGTIAPAAGSLHRAVMTLPSQPDVIRIGETPSRPQISAIIPLYRNLSFLRFQIAAFAVDPAFRGVELIYVLDSPEQRAEVEHLLQGLHALYGMPFKLVVMARNMGFSAANNRGVAKASGRLLLLLNSDVIPEGTGWIEGLAGTLQGSPAIGAVGPKLLFDDGSLQHAGLYFEKDLRGDWFNHHFFKGYPRDYRPANVARSVPAVTGAAMLLRRDLYERVSGFTEDYIIGDYEDSDLCLKIRSLGKDIWYQPAAELFHFERRSISLHAGYTRTGASAYNRWLHAGRWNDLMHQVMNRRPARGRGGGVAAVAAE